MKRVFLLLIILSLIIPHVVWATPDVSNTVDATNITGSSFTLTGTIDGTGDTDITSIGFNYGVAPSVDQDNGQSGGPFGTGTYNFDFSSLYCDTEYIGHFYAVNSDDPSTDTSTPDFSVTTSACDAPTVATDAASNMTTTAADLNGTITYGGYLDITERGFNLGLTESYGTNVNETGNFNGGAYTLGATGLSACTLYHYRAHATVGVTTAYGSDTTFTTGGCPAVETNPASAVYNNSATLNATITNAGQSDATQHGFAYGTASDLSTVIATTTLGSHSGTGSFTSDISSLSCETTYYMRAYLTNAEMTVYGSIAEFVTGQCPVIHTLTASSSAVTATTVTLGGDITSVSMYGATEWGFVYGLTTAYGATTTDSGVLGRGAYITKWGSAGSGNGQFINPRGVAIDSSGNVYINDTENHRIQKFNSSGTYSSQWGSNGSGNNDFNFPYDVAISDTDNLYIVDTNNHRVKRTSISGVFDIEWGSSGAGNGQFVYPQGLGIASSSIFVADGDNHRIQRFDLDGDYQTQWGSGGSGNGQFTNPNDVVVDDGGYVYVSDTNNHRVQKFDMAGNYQTQWGGSGSGNGEFSVTGGVSVYGGYVYVSDTGNDRIQVFNTSGGFIGKWGTAGLANGSFDYPYHSGIDPDGYIYVADMFNSRIQKFGINSYFSENLSGLTCNSTYHYKAWAENEAGTGYSTDGTFTTSVCPDVTAPIIASVSSDKTNGTYTSGEIIDIDVTFSEAVTSTGNVTVTLETGTTDRTCTFTVSNSTTGTCNYTVQTGDTSSDLTTNSISGTIADQASNAMVNFTPTTNLATNKALVIDAVEEEEDSGGSSSGSSRRGDSTNNQASILPALDPILDIIYPEYNPPAYVVPPLEPEVPLEAQVVLQDNKWNLIPNSTIDNFALSPLPREITDLIAKFPELGNVFTEIGIAKITDLDKLQNLTINLPTIQDDNNIPTEIVVAKAGQGLINVSSSLDITSDGVVEQEIHTLGGESITLRVRPDSQADSVTGHMTFRSRSEISSINLPTNSLLASAILSVQAPGQSKAEPTKIEEKFLLFSFEYTDPDGDGIYTADIKTPEVEGDYEIITLIKYKDADKGTKELRLVTVIDPEGYVYEKNIDGREVRIDDAKVSIFEVKSSGATSGSEITEKLWDALRYNQNNPQITDKTGKYSFLVPEGTYYITVESAGHNIYKGEHFEVREGSPVHFNIELSKKNSWVRSLLDWKFVAIMIVLAISLTHFIDGRRRVRGGGRA